MDFKLRTIIILLAIIFTGIIITYYAIIIHATQPIIEKIPTDVNMYAGGDIVSRDTWIVNRAHLAQAVISRQGHHDIFLAWNMPAWPPPNIPTLTPVRFPTELTMRMFFPTPAELNLPWVPQFVRDEVMIRGGYVLLNPAVDASTEAAPRWDRINNTLANRRVNTLNVAGMPGAHYAVVQHFIDVENPLNTPAAGDNRSFRLIQFQHDNGDAFFLVCPIREVSVHALCP